MSDEQKKRPAGAQEWIDAVAAWDARDRRAPVEVLVRLAERVHRAMAARMAEVRGTLTA